MIRCIYRKNNETEEHYLLKQIAKFCAFERGFRISAEEVSLFSTNELGPKVIADVVGVRMNNVYSDDVVPKIDTICIEAKVSKADYKNGFVSSADFNYIIAPKGLLVKEDMLPGVGLIEVELAIVKLVTKRGRTSVAGVSTTVKATRNKEPHPYKVDILRQIGYRNTCEILFNRNGIEEIKEHGINEKASVHDRNGG